MRCAKLLWIVPAPGDDDDLGALGLPEGGLMGHMEVV
jgi:hypothetical protein